jgi:hypothetical protein
VDDLDALLAIRNAPAVVATTGTGETPQHEPKLGDSV